MARFSASQSLQKRAKSSSDNDSAENLKQVCSDLNTWNYTSTLKIPAQVTDTVIDRRSQDHVLDDGSFQAEYQYQTAIFHEALIYSNGASHVSAFDCNRKRLTAFSSAKFNVRIPDVCKLKPQRRLTGTTLSIYGNVEHASGNIGHWMIDGLARMFLALKHHSMADIDQVLVPRLCFNFQRDSLLALGFKDQQIVEIDALQCIQCERLLLTTRPRDHSSGATPGWVIDGFRDLLLPARAKVTTGSRIYISRRDAGSRKFVDEESIIKSLEAHGFEAVEMSNYTFEEKIALFANAEMIIGLTGAGLTNAMFCQSDAVMTELLPES